MTIQSRADSKCELWSNTDGLDIYTVPPRSEESEDNSILICENCHDQITEPDTIDESHWRCLAESMWSEVPAVQVMAWRMLMHLGEQDLLDQMYLDDETQIWAESGSIAGSVTAKHVDSNGAELSEGDTVTLIKDLDVKGSSFTAKRGTAVRRIRLVADNPEHIEGKVNDQQIVILTKFVKKSS